MSGNISLHMIGHILTVSTESNSSTLETALENLPHLRHCEVMVLHDFPKTDLTWDFTLYFDPHPDIIEATANENSPFGLLPYVTSKELFGDGATAYATLTPEFSSSVYIAMGLIYCLFCESLVLFIFFPHWICGFN